MNKRLDVGIGEFAVSDQPGEVLKTYALGSCVALVVYDPLKRVGGLVHFALPESAVNPQKASDKPCYFVDSGMPVFFSALARLGATRQKAVIRLVGGASILDEKNTFDIGRRNTLAVKKFLWRMGLAVHSEDVGGAISRTVAFSLEDGGLQISNGNQKWTL